MITVRVRSIRRTQNDPHGQTSLTRVQELKPSRTAVVICDMWDRHWCQSATKRVAELAPRVNDVAAHMRNLGALIVHAPSGTLRMYQTHPARQAAVSAPAIADHGDLLEWSYHDPAHEAMLPIDDSDGGCSCSPRCPEHSPWTRQISEIEIRDVDIIADGIEVFNVYAERAVQNVILLGVHANMCVLGRPFGIRQSIRRGLNVLLMRDLTDSMYNPARRPRVDHFTGTDLIVRHIETYWCSTLTSDQIIGGRPFRFSEDTRQESWN